MNAAIETSNLTRDFGKFRAVNELNLRVEAGRFYGFLGPNGAGKSTTIKMLTGLLAPSGGTMRILGEDLSDPRRALEVKRRIGVVPENLALFDNLTAREYLTFIGRMYLLPRDTVRERCDELLAMMDLAHEEKKLTLEFSHGMKKKLALAAALIPNPDLLFLDEPFEGVDAVASRVLRDTLKQCVGRGATVFLTSHVLEIVEKLCTGRRHHRAGKTGSSRHDGGVAARRLAGGQIPRRRGQRRARGAEVKLAGGLNELGATQDHPLAALAAHAQPVGARRRPWRGVRRDRRRQRARAGRACFVGALLGGAFGLGEANPPVSWGSGSASRSGSCSSG